MDYRKWIAQTKGILVDYWGLSSAFADLVSLFLAYCFNYQLKPVVTSGFRDSEKQKTLLKRWQAGDKGVVVKPAVDSLHSKTSWLGRPAALAVDVSTSNPALAAQIAKAVGIGAGYYFKTPDRVHFFQQGAK